jgi:hypothetical protein
VFFIIWYFLCLSLVLAVKTEAQVTLQCSKAMEVYDAKVKQATNSNPHAFNNAELGALVGALERR